MPLMSKAAELEKIRARMAADASLPLSTNLVFGEGNPDSPLVFIGEAPGAKEDELIRPFVGRGGQLLNKNIERIGWRREDVYITNIVKRRPPDNRDPLPEEIAAYQPYLVEQLEILNPLLVVPLGRFAMNHFLPDAKITRDQGSVFQIGGRFVMPMFHPAAALRNPTSMKAFEATFDKLPAVLRACAMRKDGVTS
jgi:uracil-DNA glycosylase